MEVLAASYAAFDYTGKTVLRVPSEGARSNRELIDNYVNGRESPLVITEAHRQLAAEVGSYLDQVKLIKLLTHGRNDSFLESLIEAIKEDTVEHRSIGLIAWIPKSESDFRKQEKIKVESSLYEPQSKFVGKVKDTIQINFTLIEKRYLKDRDMYSVYGRDEHGNLFFYWANNAGKIVEAGAVQGRVKAHKVDPYRNKAHVTYLNYVKVV